MTLHHLQVHVLSETPLAWRQIEMEAEGLELDGSGTFISKEEAEKGAEGQRNGGLRNARVTQHTGFTTDENAMKKLPIGRANAVVVVADTNPNDSVSGNGGAELQIADSECLTSTILLRRIHSVTAKQMAADGKPPPPPLTLVTQFEDLLTRRLLERQPDLLDSEPAADEDDAEVPMAVTVADGEERSPAKLTSVETVGFHRNYIETTCLSLAAQSSACWAAISMLLDPEGRVALKTIKATMLMRPIELTEARKPAPLITSPTHKGSQT